MTGVADKIGDSDMKSVLSKGGMTADNAEYQISYPNEHYRKPFRIMQLAVTYLRSMLSRYLIKEHAFNEVIDYVEGHTGSDVVLSMACDVQQMTGIPWSHHATREKSYPQIPIRCTDFNTMFASDVPEGDKRQLKISRKRKVIEKQI